MDDEESRWVPYLVGLAAAAVVGLALAGYVWVNRAEIIRVLTQSTT